MRVIVEDGTERVVIEGGKASVEMPEPWDGTTISATLLKSAPERRFTLLCAYPAMKADQARAADGHVDFASPEALELAAWEYMSKSPEIGVGHEFGTEGAGVCVESYIYRGPDWIIKAHNGEECVIKAGDWLIGVIWRPEIWSAFLRNEYKGVSMQGRAERRKPSREALAQLRR